MEEQKIIEQSTTDMTKSGRQEEAISFWDKISLDKTFCRRLNAFAPFHDSKEEFINKKTNQIKVKTRIGCTKFDCDSDTCHETDCTFLAIASMSAQQRTPFLMKYNLAYFPIEKACYVEAVAFIRPMIQEKELEKKFSNLRRIVKKSIENIKNKLNKSIEHIKNPFEYESYQESRRIKNEFDNKHKKFKKPEQRPIISSYPHRRYVHDEFRQGENFVFRGAMSESTKPDTQYTFNKSSEGTTTFIPSSVTSAPRIKKKIPDPLIKLFDLWIYNKKLKCQSSDTMNQNQKNWTMSISYENHETVLYEIKWEMTPGRMKCSSLFYNKIQKPWELDWSQENIEKLLMTLNKKVTYGKVCLDRRKKRISFCATIDIPPYLLNKDKISKFSSALYAIASRSVMELSNAIALYHSNPSLKPSDIGILAKDYGKVEVVSTDNNKAYIDVFDLLGQKPHYNIQWKKITISKKIEIKGYSHVYEGKYLNLDCLCIEIDERKEFSEDNHLQFRSLLTIYGISEFKIKEKGGILEMASDSKTNRSYLIVQKFPGKLIQLDEIPSFIMEKHPEYVVEIIFEYFTTLCYLNSKGSAIQSDIALFYDEELEKKYLKSGFLEEDPEDAQQGKSKINKCPWLSFCFFPQIYQENESWLESFANTFASNHFCDKQDNLEEEKEEKAIDTDISYYLDNYINRFNSLKENLPEYLKFKNINIFKNYVAFVDFLVRTFLNVSLQEFSDKYGIVNLLENEESRSIFCGLEYISHIIKKCLEFLIVGVKITQDVNDKNAKELNDQVINSVKNLDSIYDKEIGLDCLIEESPTKMIFNYDSEQDLF
ncbi:unnamed protein product [Moneuplotes crassus]|uniref:Uncharacterized protein n=2 Tax=Euplotes crassus TaxID=5936 RepID=A0AAD2D1Q5_EUPCR|nr:unnamed protein product [Moneuplotes crassus]